MSGKAIIGAGFMVLFALVMIIWGTVTLSKGSPKALSENTSKGDLCELNVDFAFEVFEVKNTVNLIPIGKEHYYIMAEENEEDFVPFLVNAKPSWMEKRFDAEEGWAKSGAVKVTGVVSQINYEIRDDVTEASAELADMGVNISGTLFIDARYKEFGVLRILSGVALAVLSVLEFLGTASGVLKENKFLQVLLGIMMIATVALGLYTLQLGN